MNYKEDGVDHINVYSKGITKIGKYLSNFSRIPFEHPEDGKFMSVEGYWYWLGCKDDRLRQLSGFAAKKYGRESGADDWQDGEEFIRKVKLALYSKINQNNNLKSMLKESSLPFTHYYVYGDKRVEPKEGKWVIDYLEELRNEIRNK